MTNAIRTAALGACLALFVAAPLSAQKPATPDRPAKSTAAARAVSAAAAGIPAPAVPDKSAEARRFGGSGAAAAAALHPAAMIRPEAMTREAKTLRPMAGPTASLDGVVPTLHSPAVRTGPVVDERLSRLLREARIELRTRPEALTTPVEATKKEGDGGA